MSARKTSRAATQAMGACALLTLILELVPTKNEASDETGAAPTLTQKLIVKTTNDVGCLTTAITWPHKPKVEGTITSFLYSRPLTLNVEHLSDYELGGCGLQPQRKVRHLPKDSLEYQAWLARANQDMAGKPVPIPEGNPVYHPRDPRYHWPDPPEPNNGQQHDVTKHSSLNMRQNSVVSADASNGYNHNHENSFAGRIVIDGHYPGCGPYMGAYPTITSVIAVPGPYMAAPPQPTNSPVTTLLSYWVGYATHVDTFVGGSALAQAGIVDYYYTSSTGAPSLEAYILS